MRRILLSLLLFMTLSASSQVTLKFMGELEQQYEKCLNYMQGISKAPSNNDTTYLVQQADLFNAMANSVYEDADLNQKKALLYYITVLQFRMGYIYAAGEYWADAYERFYKNVESGMKYIIQPGWFPVIYETEGHEYTIDRTYITKIESIFYMDFLNASLTSGHWQAAREVNATIQRSRAMSYFEKYVASSAMIIFMLKGKNMEDLSEKEKDDLFDFYADNIRNLGELNAAEKQKIIENHGTDYETRYKEVMELTQSFKPIWKASRYEKLGVIYWYVKDTAKANFFFTNVINLGYSIDYGNLTAAADLAIATKDKELCLKIAEQYKEVSGIDKECYRLSVIGNLYEIAGKMPAAKTYYRMSNKCGKRNR